MKSADLSPECSYLVDLCAKERGFMARRNAEAGPGFDWEVFLDACDRHKVVALAYRAFLNERKPRPPRPVMERLKRAASAKAAVNAFLCSELERVLAAFRAAGIRALVLKGPALALQFHDDVGQREFRDIDLLVDGNSESLIVSVLQGLGYLRSDEAPWLSPAQKRFLGKRLRHWRFKKKGGFAIFEIHIDGDPVRDLLGQDPESAFNRSETLPWRDAGMPTLGREDHATFALRHGAWHTWCTLQWVLDVMASMDSMTGQGGDYLLSAFRSFSRRLFILPLPGGDDTKSMRRARRLSSLAYRNFRIAGAITGGNRINANRIRTMFLLRPGLAGLASTLAFLLEPNLKDFSLARGRGLPLLVYYLYRPVRVAFTFLRRAMEYPG
jgi:hypothetical protein